MRRLYIVLIITSVYWTCANRKIRQENTNNKEVTIENSIPKQESAFIENEIIVQFNEIEKENILLESLSGYEIKRINQVSKTLKINRYQFNSEKISLQKIIELIQSQKETFGVMHAEPNKKISLDRSK